MGWAVIAGVAVTGIIAFALKDIVRGPLRSLWFVVGGLLVWSIVMFCADKFGKQDRGEDSITWKDGALLGLIQCFSLIPGVSRSGATISGALFLGIDRLTATRMSFFLGIPTLVAAGGFEAVSSFDEIAGPGGVGWAATIIGIVISFVVGYVSIAWLLKFVASNNFTAFVIYRIVLAVIIGGLLLAGVITPV